MQFYGPDPHKGDDASFRLLDNASTDVRWGDFEVMALGPVTRVPS